MSFPDDTTEMCRSGDYRMVQIFDMAQLTWPGGEMIVGDHFYADPQCAVIDEARGWCVSGGQGLEICLFEDGLPRGAADSTQVKRLHLWRNENPPPDGDRYWLVTQLWHLEDDSIRVHVNSPGKGPGLYEVDVRTLEWRHLSSSP
jgi:hypothetical protein